jgi:hypothetical protein
VACWRVATSVGRVWNRVSRSRLGISWGFLFRGTGQVYTGDTRNDTFPFDYHFKEHHPLKKYAINYKLQKYENPLRFLKNSKTILNFRGLGLSGYLLQG